MLFAIKIFTVICLSTFLAATAEWLYAIYQLRSTTRRRIRIGWALLIFETAILVAWVALAIFDLRPPIDPIRIAASLWKRLWN